MNIITLLKSLTARATRLEEDAKDIRLEAAALQALILGETSSEGAPAPQALKPPGPKSQVSKSSGVPSSETESAEVLTQKKMPSADEIRAKAAEFGVDIADLIPHGRKPTLQAKNDAMRRIVEAKRNSQSGATTQMVSH